MARTVLDENIRNERIVLVGEYVKKNKASTRKAAEYFSKYQFKISNATVSDYITRFAKLKSAQINKIKEDIINLSKQEVKDTTTLTRVIKAGELFTSGYSIEAIADTLNEDVYTIYRDIYNRLEYADKGLYNEAISLMNSVTKKRKNGK